MRRTFMTADLLILDDHVLVKWEGGRGTFSVRRDGTEIASFTNFRAGSITAARKVAVRWVSKNGHKHGIVAPQP